jgi:hypothetical protein
VSVFKLKQHVLFWVVALLALTVLVVVVKNTSKTDAAAGINKTINFQGKMTNSNGTNVANGTYTFVFKLYTVSSAGTAVWTETDSLTVTDGIFQVNLGAVTTLPGSVDFNTDNIYLGITFNSDPAGEMTPRVQLTSSPYAFNADKLDGLDASALVQLSPGAAQTGNIAITGSLAAGSGSFVGDLVVDLASPSSVFRINDQSGNPQVYVANGVVQTLGASVVVNSAPSFFVSSTSATITTSSSIALSTVGSALLSGSQVYLSGTALTVSAIVQGTNALIFDGATAGDGFTTTFAITDPTGSNTITFPDASGEVCLDIGNCGAGGSITVGALNGGTANANGTTISAGTLYLQSASVTYAGLVDTTTQSFAGNKTFTGTLAVSGQTNLNGNIVLGDASGDTVTFTGRVNSDILPTTNDTYNLGSDTNRWKDLYLGGETIHIGTSTSDEATLGYNTTTNSLISKNAINSTTAFQIQDTSGAGILTVDTVNSTTTFQSKGALGPELFTAGSCTGTNWTGTGPWTHVAGTSDLLTCTPPVNATVAKRYVISFTISGAPAGPSEYAISMLGGIGGVTPIIGNYPSYSYGGVASGTTPFQFITTTGWNGTISGISIKEIVSTNAALQVKGEDGTVGLEIRSGSSITNDIFIGLETGQYSVGGGFNTGVGSRALSQLTTGAANTATGFQSLSANTTGAVNTALGYQTLYSSITGTGNTALGAQALYLLQSGGGNIALGTSTGANLVSGSNNIFLGNNLAASSSSASNELNIGNVVRGNTSTGSALFKNTTNSTTAFQIQNSSGTELLTADTSNNRIHVGNQSSGTTASVLVLDSADQTSGSIGATPVLASSTTVNGASAANITINIPTGTANGDLLIASISTYDAAPIPVAPGGWTQLTTVLHNTKSRTTVFWRIASGDTAGTGRTWTLSAVYRSGAMMRVTGANTTSPFDTYAGRTFVDDDNFSFAAVTTTQINELGIGLMNAYNNASNGAIPNWTTAATYDINFASIRTRSFATATTYGVETSATADTISYASVTLAIAPASTFSHDDPTGVNGAMYYNSNANRFRCYQNSGWADCVGSGITTVGALDGNTYNANGASISGSTLYLQAATASNVGLVTTSTQTFGGNKTIAGDLAVIGGDTFLKDVFIDDANTLYFGDGSTTDCNNITCIGEGYFSTGFGMELDTHNSGSMTLTAGGSSVIFNGMTTDITSGTNEALTVTANGTGDILFTTDDDTNFVISGTRTNTGSHQSITMTLGNDTGVDTVAALGITVTSAGTGDADILQGIAIADLVSANVTVIERALQIGSGWDANLFFNDTTTQLQVVNTGVITFEDDAGNDLLTVTDAGTTGTVGITGTLGVSGAATTGRSIQTNGILSVKGTAARLQLEPSGGGTTNLWNIDNDSGDLRFFTESYSATGIGAGGSVKVSVASTGIMTVNGTSTCIIGSGTGTTSCTSDERKKHDITALQGNLEKINQMDPVSYYWNSDPSNTTKRIGLIAQDVKELFPEAVAMDDQGFYTLDYSVLVSPLIGAVKELSVQVSGNTHEISVVRDDVAVLSSTLSGYATTASIQSLFTNLATRVNTLEQGNFSSITVNGPALFQSTLTVKGDVFIKNITLAGKFITAGTLPTTQLAMTGTGVNGDVEVSGNDTAGMLIYTAGTATITNPLVAGKQFMLTFTSPFTAIPRVNLTAASEDAASVRYFTKQTMTGFSITFIDPPLPGKEYAFNYFVVQ